MRLFFFIILLFSIHTCTAQHTLVYDSSKTNTRTFSTEKIKSYNDDTDFQYNRYKEPPASMWDRFWAWFWSKIGELLGTEGGSAAVNSLLIILGVFGVGFFIYKLTGMGKSGLFKKNAGDVSRYTVTDEDIYSINFDEAIEQAIANGNYRLAVRLLYLQTLKKLADKNVISWQLNKTNIAYVQELSGLSYQNFFGSLTWQFESNWYGDMPIDSTSFNTVREQFNQFNQQLV
jgi:hypothetical protein